MHSQYVILALIAAASAVPLNINLGAYSPALVVGDGEITLGSTESASRLMATLASGAAAGGGGGEAAPKGQQGTQTAGKPSPSPAGEQSQPATGEPKKEAEGGDNKDKPAESKPAKRAPNLARALERLLGKREPAPIPAEDQMAAVEAAMQWIKRDLAGFEAALGYAREAQKDAPKVELGTENAGIGILVNAGSNVAKGSAAAGDKPNAAERRRKRAEVVAEESDTPKMTLVAITEV